MHPTRQTSARNVEREGGTVAGGHGNYLLFATLTTFSQHLKLPTPFKNPLSAIRSSLLPVRNNSSHHGTTIQLDALLKKKFCLFSTTTFKEGISEIKVLIAGETETLHVLEFQSSFLTEFEWGKVICRQRGAVPQRVENIVYETSYGSEEF
jgi:hypothetical protein